MKERVVSIICEVAGLNREVLHTDRDLQAYGVTSALLAEVVAECEDVFSVHFEPNDLGKLRTVDQLVAYLETRVAP